MTTDEYSALKAAHNRDQRRRSAYDESRMQRACIRWFRAQYPGYILFAIPNGGKRGEVEGGILKGEGVLAGVADLFLSMPSGRYSGLYIEIKTPKGRHSPAQKDFEKRVVMSGYAYVICRSVEEFIETIEKYLHHVRDIEQR
jgi:hypothetical protein